MQVRAIRTRIFKEKEDVVAFVKEYVPKLSEDSILVITSKILALSEGRTASCGDKEHVIRTESARMQKVSYRGHELWLTLKDGMLMANAGVDASNADGKIVLLPKNSFKAAERIRCELKKHYRVKRLGVLITDSRTMPLRAGVTGVALGYAGFAGVRDYRGRPDIFGRRLVYTRTNIADSLATAAALVMGEGSERQPLALIERAPVEWRETMRPREVMISLQDDIYQILLREVIPRKKRARHSRYS